MTLKRKRFTFFDGPFTRSCTLSRELVYSRRGRPHPRKRFRPALSLAGTTLQSSRPLKTRALGEVLLKISRSGSIEG